MQIINGKLVNEDLEKRAYLQNIVTKNAQDINKLQENYSQETEKISYIVTTLYKWDSNLKTMDIMTKKIARLEQKLAQQFLIILVINVFGFMTLGGWLIVKESNNEINKENKLSQLYWSI